MIAAYFRIANTSVGKNIKLALENDIIITLIVNVNQIKRNGLPSLADEQTSNFNNSENPKSYLYLLQNDDCPGEINIVNEAIVIMKEM